MPSQTRLFRISSGRCPISTPISTVRGLETALSPQRTNAAVPVTTTRAAIQNAVACWSSPSSAAPVAILRDLPRATVHIRHSPDTPVRTPGNQGTDRCACETLSTYSPAVPQRRHASDRFAHVVHHSHCPSRHKSDKPRDTTRNEYTRAAPALQRPAPLLLKTQSMLRSCWLWADLLRFKRVHETLVLVSFGTWIIARSLELSRASVAANRTFEVLE